jgi:glyoxylase-like metal-dependent hydrolase (beta-lactamase superfamily II)
MSASRRTLLQSAAALASTSLLPWSIPEAVAQALRDEAKPTEVAHLNSYPAVEPQHAREIAPGVTVIPDPRINLVPNVGIITGRDAVLVVDTGIGAENGRRVLELARQLAGGKPIILTLTHFHPEHGYGAQVFKGQGQILYNKRQADELSAKGQGYLDLFRTFGPSVSKALEGTQVVLPDETYTGERLLDLGGRRVVLRELPAHTEGDQIVYLPDEGILFTGDLVENRFFPIFPDADAKGGRWIEVLQQMEALQPRTVVPGHGAVAGPEVIRSVRDYLTFVQDQARALARAGVPDEAADHRLTPEIRQRYANWDNEVWIPFAIRVFYAEETGKPLNLPKL